MSDLGTPFNLTDVDGVPCFWADVPGPCSAGLLFRVGRADEQLASGGVTRLVERLALGELGHTRYEYSGQVAGATTAFYATGEPGEITSFVAHVGAALGDLPGEAIVSEQRVLTIEEQREEPGALARMLALRFGAQGHGLAFHDQYGLRWLRHEHVRDWAARWFTRANATLWMTRPPEPGLHLPLPAGERHPAPEPVPIGRIELPVFAAGGDSGVASTLVAPRSAALAAATRTVADRLHDELDAPHELSAWQIPLTGSLSHRYLAVDTSDGVEAVLGAMSGAFDAVAADGPTREELETAHADTLRVLAADEAAAAGLERLAVDELLGAPRRWKEDVARESEAVSYAEAAAALREALATQILLAPTGTPPPDRPMRPYPWYSDDQIEGSTLKPLRGANTSGRLVVSQEGVSQVGADPREVRTVRFAEIAAAIQEPHGALTLIGRDGALVGLDPHRFKDGGRIVAGLEERLPPELVVPPARDSHAGGGGLVDQVARRKLHRRWLVDTELKLLPERLDHGEEVLTLSEATMGTTRGLLALTDRRIFWVSRGTTEPVTLLLPYGDVIEVKLARVPSRIVTVRSPAGEVAFSQIHPKERGQEMVDEVRRRAAAARAPQ